MQTFGNVELGRAAGRIWTEGRANTIDWEIRTTLGTFTTDDRTVWRTDNGGWTAELRRSKSGRHWFLAVFDGGVYRGRYDASGWHTATDRKRIRHLRSYQLPLVA
jgi:hypothetical protein